MLSRYKDMVTVFNEDNYILDYSLIKEDIILLENNLVSIKNNVIN